MTKGQCQSYSVLALFPCSVATFEVCALKLNIRPSNTTDVWLSLEDSATALLRKT
ncbi:MAG: hypothetical protein KME27_21395 [Lyngbya sp. HA4199-MV5]|nr:hypothetical protein [Lyngbya sp. HA4199-MV5]